MVVEFTITIYAISAVTTNVVSSIPAHGGVYTITITLTTFIEVASYYLFSRKMLYCEIHKCINR
jgi:hypothetical protein